MKKFLFLLLFPSLIFSQQFISKVSQANGYNIKYETHITITDSTIRTYNKDYDLTYIVENQVQYYYDLDLYSNKFNLTIAEVKGRSKGFSYTHVMTLTSLTQQMPPLIYFCALKEED